MRPSHVYCPAMVPPCEGEARETRRVHTRICQGTYKRYATTSFARLAVFGRVLADRQSQPVVLPLKAVQQPAPRENERRGSRHQGCGRSMLRPSGLSKVAFTKECQVGAGALRKHAFAVPFSSARVIVRHVIAFRENTTRCRWRGFDRLNDAGASRACALRGLRAGTHTASLWCCPAWWLHSFFGWRARREQHVLTRLPATPTSAGSHPVGRLRHGVPRARQSHRRGGGHQIHTSGRDGARSRTGTLNQRASSSCTPAQPCPSCPPHAPPCVLPQINVNVQRETVSHRLLRHPNIIAFKKART